MRWLAGLLLVLVVATGMNQAQEKKAKAKPALEFAPVTDDPALPRVLLIGDSISIGYTVPTRKKLPVNVHFTPAGSAALAEQVAAAIEKQLPKR
jgi:acyl-CoA thioesterase-1